MTLSDTINAYYMPLYSPDPAVIEYYSEIFEGLNCLQWESMRAARFTIAAQWQNAGWNLRNDDMCLRSVLFALIKSVIR